MRSHSLSRLTFIPHPHSRSFDCRRHSCKDHHRTPPLPLDVVLELDAERTVIPGGFGPAVDLAGLEHQPAAFGQVCNGVDD